MPKIFLGSVLIKSKTSDFGESHPEVKPQFLTVYVM